MKPNDIPKGTKATYTDRDATVTLTTSDGTRYRWSERDQEWLPIEPEPEAD